MQAPSECKKKIPIRVALTHRHSTNHAELTEITSQPFNPQPLKSSRPTLILPLCKPSPCLPNHLLASEPAFQTPAMAPAEKPINWILYNSLPPDQGPVPVGTHQRRQKRLPYVVLTAYVVTTSIYLIAVFMRCVSRRIGSKKVRS